MKQKFTNESGVALVFAIGLLALMLAVGIAFVGNALLFKKVAENNSSRTQARMLANTALSRAVTSVMIFQEQMSAALDGGIDEVTGFENVYSYSEVMISTDKDELSGSADPDEKISTDGLIVENGDSESKMLLPEDDAVIPKSFAKNFNLMFKSSGNEAWKGAWVYFYDTPDPGNNNRRRIIGRAAWQVVGSPANILAPVFLRGVLSGTDPFDGSFVPNDSRWGREIDEVYLESSDVILGKLFDGTGVRISLTEELTTYDYIYTSILPLDDAGQKLWFERWFIPEQDKGTVKDPTPIAAETYSEDKNSDRRFLRFNISELWDNNKYGGVSQSADPWYARFNVDSIAAASTVDGSVGGGNSYDSKPIINGEGALELLSRDPNNYIYEPGNDDCDYDLALDDRTSLSFLRLIGSPSDNPTFEDAAAWRKQIAANFNDYSDADSVPTSDINAADWGPKRNELAGAADAAASAWWSVDAAVTKEDPKYTGNEKSPYLYEFGAALSLEMTKGLTAADGSNEYKFADDSALKINMLPIVKLVNIYPTAEIGDLWESSMAAEVDFGKLTVSAMPKQVLLKDVKLVYEYCSTPSDENAVWEPRSLTVDITVDAGSAGGNVVTAVTRELTVANNWQNSAGTAAPESVYFADVLGAYYLASYKDKNNALATQSNTLKSDDFSISFDINSLPASFDVNSVTCVPADENEWTKVKAMYQAIGSSTYGDNGYRLRNTAEATASDKSKLFTEAKPGSIFLKKITPEKISFQPRIALKGTTKLLTSPVNVASAVNVGVDYAKLGTIEKTFTASDSSEWSVNFETGNPAVMGLEGVLIGGMRNYDPRQNLNPGDWKLDALAWEKLGNYQTISSPQDSNGNSQCVINNAMCIEGSGSTAPITLTGKVNASSSLLAEADGEFNPSIAPGNRDKETVTEPSAEKSRISTAYIRNAPMMSPWEIGFVHRGIRWQTINLKKAGHPDGGTFSLTKSPFVNDGSWSSSGTSYAEGDAAILEQIRMTEACSTYGKINMNMLTEKHNGDFKADQDIDIFRALFRRIRYGENPGDFIKSSTRDASRKFSTAPTSGTLITSGFDTAFEALYSKSSNDPFACRAEVINYTGGGGLSRGFGLAPAGSNDAAEEEIIGKTINLLSAQSSTSIIRIVIVAQSIKDVGGMQVKSTSEQASSFNGDADVDNSDDVASKECRIGVFDYYEHNTDHEKNVYFDEITSEVKMLVTLDREQGTGKLSVRKIEYIE